MLDVFITLSCITLLARISPLRTIMCTSEQILERYKAGQASKKEKALLLSLSMNFRPANAEELSIEGRVLDVDLICAELAKKLLQAKQVQQEKPLRFCRPC